MGYLGRYVKSRGRQAAKARGPHFPIRRGRGKISVFAIWLALAGLPAAAAAARKVHGSSPSRGCPRQPRQLESSSRPASQAQLRPLEKSTFRAFRPLLLSLCPLWALAGRRDAGALRRARAGGACGPAPGRPVPLTPVVPLAEAAGATQIEAANIMADLQLGFSRGRPCPLSGFLFPWAGGEMTIDHSYLRRRNRHQKRS